MRKYLLTLLVLVLITCGSEPSSVDISAEPIEPVTEDSTTTSTSTTTTIFVEEPFAVDEYGIELIEMGSEMKEQFDSLVSFVEKRTGLKFTEYPKYQLYTLNGYQEYNAVSYLDDFEEDYEEGEWERAVLSENMWGLTEATPDQMKNLLVEFQRCASAGSYNLLDNSFIKSLSNFSLKAISTLPCTKDTRLTLVSSSYFNLISFFFVQISIRSSKLLMNNLLVISSDFSLVGILSC